MIERVNPQMRSTDEIHGCCRFILKHSGALFSNTELTKDAPEEVVGSDRPSDLTE